MQKIDVMPRWDELLTLALQYYGDDEPHNNRAARIDIADAINLTEELRQEKYTKSKGNKIENRAGWALSGLKIAGLLRQYERGSFQITDEGKKLLRKLPEHFDEKFLKENYPAYQENCMRNQQNYLQKKNASDNGTSNIAVSSLDPRERIEDAFSELNNKLGNELLEQLCSIDPYVFERVVSDLLIKMGYGDSETTPKSRDGGIDAIVKEDKLGLDKIFVQVKRYSKDNPITEKQMRDFLGALSAWGVQKGIFVTTSHFDKRARLSAEKSDKKVRLVEGDELASLMIEYGIGVSTIHSYEIKIFDGDYFDNL